MAKKTESLAVLPEDRSERLTALRNLKMARSAHAFVRGNTVHDIVRLAVSLATAARGSDLPGVTTARMVEHLVDGYERAMGRGHRTDRYLERPASIKWVVKRALKRRWKHLAQERIDGIGPDIPLGRHFWPVDSVEHEELQALAHGEAMCNLVTQLRHREADAPVTLVDAKYWVKGCSSLGRLRYALLLRIGERAKDGELCLIDVKEALKAAAPRNRHEAMPRDNAERVQMGARFIWHRTSDRA